MKSITEIPASERAAFIAKCQEMVDGGMTTRAVARYFEVDYKALRRKVFSGSLGRWKPKGRTIAADQIARRLSVPGMPL